MAHLSELKPYDGILSRNSTYKADARSRLDGLGIYNNVAQITAALTKIVTVKHGGSASKIKHYNAQYGTPAQRAPAYILPYTNPKNGQTNFESSGFVPYTHQAHHVVPIEVFHNDKWSNYLKPGRGIRTYLQQLRWSKYNINNKYNILYLPQINSIPQNNYFCEVHQLPDHSTGHPKYNKNVSKRMHKVYQALEKAADAKSCKAKKIRNNVRTLIKKYETQYTRYILAKGKSGTGSSAPGRLGTPPLM
jgi:hypothetical protein